MQSAGDGLIPEATSTRAGATAISAMSSIHGQWHFVVMTRNATNGLENVFVDGVLDGNAVGQKEASLRRSLALAESKMGSVAPPITSPAS